MKKLIVVVVALVMFGGFSSFAQELKFGHVKTDSVLVQTETFKAIQREQKATETGYQKKGILLQEKMLKINSEATAMADSLGGQLDAFWTSYYQGQMDMEQQALQLLDQTTQQTISILEERMMMLYDLYREAVANVAKANGITYVFDASSGLLFAGPKGKDLTEQVKVELIKLDNAKVPAIHRYP